MNFMPVESKEKNTFVYFPAFEDIDDVSNVVPRAFWYLAGPLRSGAKLVVPTAGPLTKTLTPPAHIDASVHRLFKEFRKAIQWRQAPAFSLTDLLEGVESDSVTVLCHKADVLPAVRQEASRFGNVRVVNIDPDNSQYESSLYLKLTSNDGQGTNEDIAVCKARFDRMVSDLDTRRVFIFGTGPSLDTVDFASLPAGEKIVTNSMVVNDDLMQQIKPRVIVASDPIFHAGCSSYAGEFREKLIQAMRAHGSYFIFPMRDYGVYKAHFPADLQEHLVGIPLVSASNLNTRLGTAFHVSSQQNVMTLFLLPIAASVSKEIVLAGFDGRPIRESSYFWSHSKASQLNHRMDEIQQAHPAFFKISYNDYLFRHMRTVARYLDEAERNGCRVISITESHVPAIKGRYIKGEPSSVLVRPQPEVSVIIPCYNAAETIEETIASLFDQSLGDWEAICVDDGSTDATWEKLTNLAARDSRIRPWHQENGGVSVARNTGLSLASGRYACFLDADDILYPKSLEVRVEHARKAEPDTIVYGELVMTDEKGRELNVSSGKGGDITFDQFDRWPGLTTTALGPAHLFKSAAFRPKLAYCEDWLYFSEIARSGVKFVQTEERIAAYRWHPDAATQREFEQNIVQTAYVVREISADDWENGMLHPDYAIGIPSAGLHQMELRRMYAILAQCILRNDLPAATRICDYISRKARRTPLKEFTVDDIERAAVRTVFEPFNSPALYSRLAQHVANYGTALDAVIVDRARHAAFHKAFSAFIRRIAKEAGLLQDPAFADATARAELGLDKLPAGFGWRRDVYLLASRMPLLRKALDPIKKRYLRRHGFI